jgi:hypothetical protein
MGYGAPRNSRAANSDTTQGCSAWPFLRIISTMSGLPNRKAAGGPGWSARSFRPAAQGGRPLTPEIQPHHRWLTLAIALLLALVVWTVFGRTLRYGFVNYDDDLYVYENPVVEKGLTWDGIHWAFTHNLVNNWHPLTVLSYMADAQCYGRKAGGYHLTNVLLHTFAVILLFVVLKQMTGALWRSALVAAVFAIHPLRLEWCWPASSRPRMSKPGIGKTAYRSGRTRSLARRKILLPTTTWVWRWLAKGIRPKPFPNFSKP